MARKWTDSEKSLMRDTLQRLYVIENLSIHQVAVRLGIAYQTVYERLIRLSIPIQKEKKVGYLNKHKNISFPRNSALLAEFLGIMLGDGHISQTQVFVHLGGTERQYAEHISSLMRFLFNVSPRVVLRKRGHIDVYFGSVAIVCWLKSRHGLCHNKVQSQVGVPDWIFKQKQYQKSCVRGLFDTDGSVYALRHGIQVSFTNLSIPLLQSMHDMLISLGYQPSCISDTVVYLTRREQVTDFFKKIQPNNGKHIGRFKEITSCVGR